MILNREKLLKAVETVSPALEKKPLIEELTCIWLDGETMTAYNDASLGIQIPFKSEVKGGIKGSLLLALLQSSRVAEVELTAEANDNARLKAGRAKLDLALLPVDKAMWELPNVDGEKPFKPSQNFLDGLKDVQVSIGTNVSVPEQLGVTVFSDDGIIELFTQDFNTLSWASDSKTKGFPLKAKERAVLPALFTEQLVALGDKDTEIVITKDNVLATTSDGTKLFARLIHVPEPMDFMQTIKDLEYKPFVIPKRWPMILERAIILLGEESEGTVDLTIHENVLRVYVKTNLGELRDSSKLDNEPGNINVSVRPDLLKRGLEICTEMAITTQNTIMIGDRATYLVSNLDNKDDHIPF